MSSAYRFLGWGYVAACTAIVAVLGQRPEPVAAVAVPTRAESSNSSGRPATARPARQQRLRVVPPGQAILQCCRDIGASAFRAAAQQAQGVGYHAACFALAGKIDDARHLIDGLDQGGRQTAAYIVFNVGHPVADAGDDRSAGPIMELVIDYLPNDYMALYHAGMAEYMLGQRDLSRKNLEAFLKLYQQDDGWRRNGLEVLGRLKDSTNTDADRRRPHEPGE